MRIESTAIQKLCLANAMVNSHPMHQMTPMPVSTRIFCVPAIGAPFSSAKADGPASRMAATGRPMR